MNEPLRALRLALGTRHAVTRVVVLAVFGSAPREPGATMLVDGERRFEGTIGGGHLEWKATALARDLLHSDPGTTRLVQRFTLGATLGQCCGGAVELLFERWTRDDLPFLEEALARSRLGPTWMSTVIEPAEAPLVRRLTSGPSTERSKPQDEMRVFVEKSTNPGARILHERLDPQGAEVWIFGAGHVGSALVAALAPLSLRLTWVDSREDAFAEAPGALGMQTRISEDPAFEVSCVPAGALALVMTHEHELDYRICRALLERDDLPWVGLIASDTKAARFRHRLQRQGLSPARMARLAAPIGIEGIRDKRPAAIAIAVAAQVLRILEARAASQADPSRISRSHRSAQDVEASRPAT